MTSARGTFETGSGVTRRFIADERRITLREFALRSSNVKPARLSSASPRRRLAGAGRRRLHLDAAICNRRYPAWRILQEKWTASNAAAKLPQIFSAFYFWGRWPAPAPGY